ncbi:MAG: HlyC/CorC family transporter [Rhodospirillales bacterium]|nr:HlyC/CorC family transporter [Rhodospirillales bacterium]
MISNDSATPADDGASRSSARTTAARHDPALSKIIRGALRRIGLVRNGEGSMRDALDDLIEASGDAEELLGEDERVLLSNILNVRGRSISDVMVPRVDIIAIDGESSLAEVIAMMTQSGHSRLPVYRESLDDAIGMVHIKDVLAWRGRDEQFELTKMVRRVLFVAPSMEVLQLLLEMRASRSHMALVVDEFGGVDGLITIEDLVEEIVGEIADEHDKESEPTVRSELDGSLDADARAPVEVLEDHLGVTLSDEEREEVDTLGGLVVSLAGRVPIRGELIHHPSGLEFEVVEADPRRIKRVRVRRPDATDGVSSEQAASPGESRR